MSVQRPLGPSSVVCIKRSIQILLAVPTGTTGGAGRVPINLAAFPGSAEFTNLFQQYKCSKFRVRIFAASASVGNGVLYFATDKTGSTSVPSISDITQISGFSYHSLAIQQPDFNYTVSAPVTFSPTQDAASTQYISTDTASTPWFGFAYVYRPSQSVGTAFDLEGIIEATWCLKGVH